QGGLHAGGPELPDDFSVEGCETLLELPRALAVAGAERGEHLRAERSGETRDGKDAPVAPQLQGGVQQRARADEDGPLRGRVAVCREVLCVARRVLGTDDVAVRRELSQQAGGELEVRVLGDVVDEDGHRAGVGYCPVVIGETRGRHGGGKVRRGPHQDGVRALRRGRPGPGHRLPGGFPTGPRDEPALVGHDLTHPPDHAALLVRLEQGRLARRARHDHSVEPRGDQPGHIVAQVDGGDLSRRAVEWRGDGDEAAPERPLRHWPGGASAGVAVRGRRRTERICFSKSAGSLLAARAVSYVTTSSATRSMRCWSNVCMPYSSRASRMYSCRSPVRLSSLISSRTSSVQIRISTAAMRPWPSARGSRRCDTTD